MKNTLIYVSLLYNLDKYNMFKKGALLWIRIIRMKAFAC